MLKPAAPWKRTVAKTGRIRRRRLRKRAAAGRRSLRLEPLESRLMLTTWHVDDDATGSEDGSPEYPFDTIQEGIEAAGAGDIVMVAAGTYRESLTWADKSFDLIGAGRDVTTVDPSVAGGGPGGRVLTMSNATGGTRALSRPRR